MPSPMKHQEFICYFVTNVIILTSISCLEGSTINDTITREMGDNITRQIGDNITRQMGDNITRHVTKASVFSLAPEKPNATSLVPEKPRKQDKSHCSLKNNAHALLCHPQHTVYIKELASCFRIVGATFFSNYRTNCLATGKPLKIDSKIKEDLLIKAGLINDEERWIGLRSDKWSGAAYWDDNSIIKENDYDHTSWFYGFFMHTCAWATEEKWYFDYCTESYFGLCEQPAVNRPTTPTIAVYDLTSETSRITLIEGGIISVNCSALLTEEINMQFLILEENGTTPVITYIEMDDERIEHYEEPLFRKGYCMLETTLVLTLEITRDLQSKRLGCVTTDTGFLPGIQPCSKHDIFCTLTGYMRINVTVKEEEEEEKSRYLISPIYFLIITFIVVAINCMLLVMGIFTVVRMLLAEDAALRRLSRRFSAVVAKRLSKHRVRFSRHFSKKSEKLSKISEVPEVNNTPRPSSPSRPAGSSGKASNNDVTPKETFVDSKTTTSQMSLAVLAKHWAGLKSVRSSDWSKTSETVKNSEDQTSRPMSKVYKSRNTSQDSSVDSKILSRHVRDHHTGAQ